MTAIIVDGRAIARDIQEDLRDIILHEKKAPRLDIVVIGEDPVTATFVRAKRRFAEKIGVEFVEHSLPKTTTTNKVVSLIKKISLITNGIVVQLPLPDMLDVNKVLSSIPMEKDVDVLGENTFGHFIVNNTEFIPPVAGAVQAILNKHKIKLSGANVVIIGKGRLVGAPVRTIFEHEKANITIIDSKTSKKNSDRALLSAEIIISGVGIPNLVTSKHISSGVVLIDAGTSNSNGAVAGDICLDCISDASLISKTPGGVGPVTVAILFRNLILGTYRKE